MIPSDSCIRISGPAVKPDKWCLCESTEHDKIAASHSGVKSITFQAVGKFFAAVISLVGIGIIAIPTGIIAAGFNHVINKEDQEEAIEEAAERNVEQTLDTMTEDDLISLQAEVSERLKKYGHTTTITIKGKE